MYLNHMSLEEFSCIHDVLLSHVRLLKDADVSQQSRGTDKVDLSLAPLGGVRCLVHNYPCFPATSYYSAGLALQV